MVEQGEPERESHLDWRDLNETAGSEWRMVVGILRGFT